MRPRAEDDPLSARAILAYAWGRMKHQWRRELLGSVIVVILGFLLAWAASGFSARGWSQVTATVLIPVSALVLWLIANSLWPAPVRLARAHVGALEEELTTLRAIAEAAREASRSLVIDPAPWPHRSLERVIERQLERAESIDRERSVTGDTSYMRSIGMWARYTADELHNAQAGELEVEFGRDGIPPDLHTVDEYRAYMEEKVRLLGDSLMRLHGLSSDL